MNINKRRGRPPVEIRWPDGVFTAQDVVETSQKRVSRVTIHSKLTKSVDSGELQIVGSSKPSNGRPRVKYLKVKVEDGQLSVPPESALRD